MCGKSRNICRKMCRNMCRKMCSRMDFHPLANWSTALPVELVGQTLFQIARVSFISTMAEAPKTRYTFLYYTASAV